MATKDEGLSQNLSFLRATFHRSVFPAMLAILSANINVFVDGILVGSKLGEDALAAISLSLPVSLFLCIVGSFFAAGTAIPAARAIGDNDPGKAQMYYRTALVTTFLASIFVTVVGIGFNRTFVAWLCPDEAIRPYVLEYVLVTVAGALPKIMLYVPFWFLRLDGKNAAVAAVMAVMSLGNVALDVLFVFGLEMGVFGAALASVIATAAAFVLGMIFLLSKKCAFQFGVYLLRGKDEWRVIAAAGTPSSLNNLLSTLRILLINAVLLRVGGSGEVAIFTAVNGIAGFAECITLGVPQASAPMLGVFAGEEDNGSQKLLLKLELVVGAIYTAVFAALALGLSGPIGKMYALDVPLFLPLLWLVLSVFPGLVCTSLSGYYNMAGKNILSNLIIFSRGIVMTAAGLFLVLGLGISTYSFLLFAEVATVGVWFIATGIAHARKKHLTRFLLMDTSLEERGNILNFSVGSTNEEICSASARISSFCENNGLSSKTTMRVELAMEEILTLITTVNGAAPVHFDLRAYYLDGITGIRIRYGGKEFNPFTGGEDDDLYMGITMLKKMVRSLYQRTFGVNTLQVTLRKAENS